MKKKISFLCIFLLVGILCACTIDLTSTTTSTSTSTSSTSTTSGSTGSTSSSTTTSENEEIVFTGYYASLQGVSSSNLKNEMKSLINKTKKTLSYDSMWDTCEEGNEDPNNPNNVILIYSGLSVKKNDHVSGSKGWNREHVYPQSLGCNKTDAHHVMPDDNKTNGIRGNNPFNYLPSGTYVQTSYETMTKSRTASGFFEPRDEVKGDIARMVMYKALAYNLSITKVIKSVDLLLQWHLQDKVDDFEINRNNIIFTYQKNRNPFIDYPALAAIFW